MFVTKSHTEFAQWGTYLFPYVIGVVSEDRVWCTTNSEPLTGGLSEKSLSNQIYSTIHRLGFMGAMLKHKPGLILNIRVANYHNTNIDVSLKDSDDLLTADCIPERSHKWREFENIIAHTFGLEVR